LALEYVLKVPLFCVAPDGTLLWPYNMDCGCRIKEILKSAEQGTTTSNTFLHVLVEGCPNHIDKSRRKQAFEPITDNHIVINNDIYPIMATDEL
jgi:hypothetical protein